MTALFGLLIPLAAVILSLCIPIVAIIVYHQKTKMRHQERLMALEKGIPIPPEPLKNSKLPPQPLYDLRSGIILLGLGTAFILFVIFGNGFNPFDFQAASGFSFFILGTGFILSGIGVAKLIWYFIAKDKFKSDDSNLDNFDEN